MSTQNDNTLVVKPGRTWLVGLIGEGIQASRSPYLHEQEARAQGLRYLYQLVDLNVLDLTPDALPRLLDAQQLMGFAGSNVTHPCKQAVIPFLDELSEDAAAIGAVNTIVYKDGKRIGHNTDWWGFAESFKRGLQDVARRRVVQLGAGGAGAAVAHAALTLGVERLALVDTDPKRAAALAERLCAHFGAGRAVVAGDLAAEMAEADGLIHATPVGMLGHPGMPLPAELLRPELWVAEVVYFPLETELLKTARALGCRTLNGGGMAVFQAVGAFRLFTGIEPDADRMLAHFAAMGA
ncbi:shikimate dehydrogenase [Crenobacter sp. SG2303]|uniref:Shikimate dehydrogenase (NADP(+)) n=1 Tax=Crenobacter oryzisoli TaxID=3056844 RepID=A0ABT7XMX9_9NEIS|nr:shikimate dehydrogenase [Crenobacter sp. SG2303]MDN0075156.1 shikimate dehydrogenase [Crenobacter sp. SG2303]